MTILGPESTTSSSHLDPNWILDGNPEGYLFWRRKSAPKCHSDHSVLIENIQHRVKFKHDVQVVEFLKQEYEDQHDYDEDKDTSSSDFAESSFPCDVGSDSTRVKDSQETSNWDLHKNAPNSEVKTFALLTGIGGCIVLVEEDLWQI
ncbi:hypothetical protein M8J76_009118 [Diaphorina citri]|nr:hypothetical protein M8J76_009118 [Diaphorina citri]